MKYLLSLLFGCILFAQVSAFAVPEPDEFVTDHADVLSATGEMQLEKSLQQIREETSIEIAVLLTPTVDDDLAFAATEIGQTWGVGDEELDNGIVILVAVEDRKRFIAVGYGLEGVITDARAKRIGERRFPTNFRHSDYLQGLAGAITDIYGHAIQDPSVIQKYTSGQTQELPANLIEFFAFMGFILTAGFMGTLFRRKTRDGKKISKKKKYIAGFVWLIVFIPLIILISQVFIALFVASMIGSLILGAGAGGGMPIMFFGGPGMGGRGGGSFGGFGGFGGGGFGGGGAGGSR